MTARIQRARLGHLLTELYIHCWRREDESVLEGARESVLSTRKAPAIIDGFE